MKHIRVLTRFSRKNMDILNIGSHAEAVIQYKNCKNEVRIKISLLHFNDLVYIHIKEIRELKAQCPENRRYSDSLRIAIHVVVAVGGLLPLLGRGNRIPHKEEANLHPNLLGA